ncbi:MAG: uridine kinase [Psychromonas sp.]|nr:uridine kinase [Psychromonas sp.]
MKTVLNDPIQLKSILRSLHIKKESDKPLIVAISGIEGGGKKKLAVKTEELLELEGIRVALVRGVDWESPKDVRFNVMNSPEEYYLHAYRYDEMFEELIIPLKLFGEIKIKITLDEVISPRVIDYNFRDIDIIIIEGVYLLQAAYIDFYDYTCWIQSDFNTAYHNLQSSNNIKDYEKVLINLFKRLLKPAAQYHIYTDDPQGIAKSVFMNDSPKEKIVEEKNVISKSQF